MALFGSKKNKEVVVKDTSIKKEKVATTKAAKVAVVPVVAKSDSPVSPIIHRGQHHDIIIRPRITEKSGIASQSGVYTFVVARDANKPTIAAAVKALYKVTPVKIGVINVPSKSVFVRGKPGVVPGIRKAVVTLKKGDKIDFV